MGKDLNGKELGTGLYQRKNGSYCGRYIDRFGKRRSVYNKKLKDLKDELNKRLYENNMHLNIVDEKITLDEWFEKWLNIYKFNVIRPNTKRHYEQVYRNHISPVYGRFKISEITQLQIRGLLKQLTQKGYKFETKNKVRILLLDMFDKAMVDDFVKKNPAKGIRLTRNEKIERRVLTPEEQAEFFDCCKGTFYDNLFTTAITTGLRLGELCALTWNDVDFESKVIKITKTLLYEKFEDDTKKTFHFGPPKTDSSIRDVPINHVCEIALKRQKIQKNVISGKYPNKVDQEFKDLLFTTKYNTPLNATILGDAIKRIIGEINLCKDPLEQFENFSPHCFRHTFATRCFEADIKPKTIQSYLGHATLTMTMDLYTHVLDDEKQNEMSKLDQLLDSSFSLSDEVLEKRFETKCIKSTDDQKLISFDNRSMA